MSRMPNVYFRDVPEQSRLNDFEAAAKYLKRAIRVVRQRDFAAASKSFNRDCSGTSRKYTFGIRLIVGRMGLIGRP